MTKVFVLYCPEFEDRAAKCKAHMAERGLSPTYWRGFAGSHWGLDTSKEYEPGYRISPGHVGLNCGTWALWQHAYLTTSNDDEPLVFFEDDVDLPVLFPLKLQDLQAQLNYQVPDWDLVFLGLAECEPGVWTKVTERIGPSNSGLCRLIDPFGTHALMIRRRALPVLMEHMRAAERNLDQQLHRNVLSKGLLSWCAVLPSLVRQRTFDYTGSGHPEWVASTIEKEPGMDRAVKATHSEVKEMMAPPPSDGRPTATALIASQALIDPFPCMYRGETYDDPGYAPNNKTVPLFQCARLGQPCHTKRNTAVAQGRGLGATLAKSCESCHYRVEMAPDSTRERLPLPDGHFNPSMLVYQGRLILATRDSWGHSKVALWEMKNQRPDWTGEWSVTPISSCGSVHPEAPRLEDPRLFIYEGALCAAFNLPDGYPPRVVQVGMARFSKDLSSIEHMDVHRSPVGNKYEKNWSPFSDDYGLHWVYSGKPEHVVMGEGQSYATPNKLPWSGGVIRGGAAPVLIDPADYPGVFPFKRKVFVHMFHGCLKRVQGSVYTIGCLVFDGHPPYQVMWQTPVPLRWPDLPAPGESVVKRFVLWPGGAVAHAGAFHVACGIDDTSCRVVRIPFTELAAALSDVPETDADVGTGRLRDTPLALGVRDM